MDVCRMGLTSLKDCGILYEWNVRRPSCVPGWGCKNIDYAMEVDFDSTNGDSGGPVFWVNSGYGIYFHSDPDGPGAHGWYSPLDIASTEYAVRTGVIFDYCKTATC
jgi:hypothetical protein